MKWIPLLISVGGNLYLHSTFVADADAFEVYKGKYESIQRQVEMEIGTQHSDPIQGRFQIHGLCPWNGDLTGPFTISLSEHGVQTQHLSPS